MFNNVDRVVTSGTRAYDIAIRIKCSGYDPDKIFVYPDLDEATASLFSTKGDKVRHSQLYCYPADKSRNKKDTRA